MKRTGWLVVIGVTATGLTTFGGSTASAAADRVVGPAGSGAAFSSIQTAIVASVDGDTVTVLPGTYAEHIDFSGRDILLRSSGGPAVTTIDAGGTGTVVTIDEGEGPGAVIEGFTIRNGWTTIRGAGVHVSFASPTIRGNRIVDNGGCTGIGIQTYFSGATIVGNVVENNVERGCSGGSGAGISIGGDAHMSTVVRGNTIVRNRAGVNGGGGISMNAAGDVLVVDNLIAENTTLGDGGGIEAVNGTRAVVLQNQITGNTARLRGAAVSFMLPGTTPLPNRFVANTIDGGSSAKSAVFLDGWMSAITMTDNVMVNGPGAAVQCGDTYYNGDPVWTNNLLWSSASAAFVGRCIVPSGSNLTADPGFEAGTWLPSAGSPLVDAGTTHPDLGALDLAGASRVVDGDGNGTRVVDIGAYERQRAVATVPGAPVAGTATRIPGRKLHVVWSAPIDDGGAPIDHYVVVEHVSRRTFIVGAATPTLDITRIRAATRYRLEIRAVNAAGTGEALILNSKKVKPPTS